MERLVLDIWRYKGRGQIYRKPAEYSYIDSIALKIPLPCSLTDLQTKFKVSKIDILYKESDALAVKVLETVNLSTPNLSTETIKYNDDTQGLKDQLYFNYVYKSNKPYKTLPEDQTTRVYDKVPIK